MFYRTLRTVPVRCTLYAVRHTPHGRVAGQRELGLQKLSLGVPYNTVLVLTCTCIHLDRLGSACIARYLRVLYAPCIYRTTMIYSTRETRTCIATTIFSLGYMYVL
jgi:hypothetical protein